MSVHVPNSCENFDDSLNQVRKFAECGNNKLVFENFSISKSYIEGRLHILVFFCIAGEVEEYFAFFRNKQRPTPGDHDGFFLGGWVGSEEVWESQRSKSIRITDSIVYPADALGLREDKVVFIGNVHSVKPPETIISSEVRLQAVNSLFIGDANALYLSGSGRCVLAQTVGNREIRALRKGASSVFDEGHHEMVKSRPEIVNGVSDDQTDARIDFSDILDHVLGKCRLRIVLRPERAWICFEKDVYPRIYITDVMVGPIDF